MCDIAVMSAATEPQQARRSNRGFASMFWSLIPLTIVIVIAVIVLRPKSQPPATVDPAPDFRFASTQLGGPVPSPRGLPAGWRATSSAVTTTPAVVVHVGYLTAGKQYVELYEAARPADVARRVGTRQGSTTIAGQPWARYRTGRGETAFLLRRGKVSVLVTGSASEADLTTFAATLR